MTITGVLAGRTVRRDLRVDTVRGVALVLMYLAHCAPTAGPATCSPSVSTRRYPLFALLVGVGAELGPRSGQAGWVGPLVRGAVLIAASQVVEGWGDADFPGGESTLRLARFLVADWPSQIVAMVFFAAIGILLTRYVLRSTRVTHGQRLTVGALCGAVAVAWIGLHEVGVFAMEAYDVTYRVLTFDALLVVAVMLVVAGAAGLLPRAAIPLAAMGGMSLTLYCLHVRWLAYDVHTLHPGASDDSWLNVAVLVLGSALLALAWRAVVRVEPWRRGLLEGPVAAEVRLLSGVKVRA